MISSPSSSHAESIQKFALEINSVHKSFGQVNVLKGVDLKLDVGERVALMGPSGSGKSTLLNCICGIESMDRGEIKLGGVSLNEMSPKNLEQIRRQSIGYVFQSFHLLPTLSAMENIEFPAQLVDMPKKKEWKESRSYSMQLACLIGHIINRMRSVEGNANEWLLHVL